jgi:multidrug efflux pump subunit AcrA (membrane-fusion protein)
VQVTIPATGEHTPAPNAEGSDAQARQARIDVIVPSVDVATNRVPIEISVPNPDGRFRAHAFAKVEIAGGQRRACACRLAP